MASSKAKNSTTGTPSHASTSTSTGGGGNHHGSGTGGSSGGGSRGGEGSSTVTTSSKHSNNNVAGEPHPKRISKGKEPVGKEIPTLDFNTLDISVLRRYKRIHKLKSVKDYAPKDELVTAVSKHYASQSVKEVDVIASFVYTVHNKNNVLKLPIP